MTTLRERRNRRQDPEPKHGTRAQLLEAAGELFAERGFDGVTGKEICARAGANAAAINYHFGGLEGLYAAVLEEARERFVNRDVVMAALAGAATPEEKLAAVVRIALRSLLVDGPASWGMRLISRELTSPSAAGAALLAATARPRIDLIRSLVCAATGLPDEHPAVSRCCLSLIGPLQILMIADHETLRRVHPGLDLSPAGVETLVEHVVRFGLAGLKAVGEAERQAG
jgi:AcrR family transcriptional regulator